MLTLMESDCEVARHVVRQAQLKSGRAQPSLHRGSDEHDVYEMDEADFLKS